MAFNVGDEVEILVGHVPNCEEFVIPSGTIGWVVERPHNNPPRFNHTGPVMNVPVNVPRCFFNGKEQDEPYIWWFMEGHLHPFNGHHRMTAPIMELEEIEMAQEVFDVLQNR